MVADAAAIVATSAPAGQLRSAMPAGLSAASPHGSQEIRVSDGALLLFAVPLTGLGQAQKRLMIGDVLDAGAGRNSGALEEGTPTGICPDGLEMPERVAYEFERRGILGE